MVLYSEESLIEGLLVYFQQARYCIIGVYFTLLGKAK